MKLHFLLVGLVAVGLVAWPPDAQAGGGGHGGGGGGGGGRGGASWHGGWHGGYYGHGRYYYRGRYYGYGPGFAFYGYPWWGWDYYGYYPYGYYPYYDDGGYSSYGQNDNGADPQFNTTRAVQAALAWRGYYSGRIDGVMGPETESAIRTFQKQLGLPVTGQIDSNLTKALQRRN
jgi:hypothetical protein